MNALLNIYRRRRHSLLFYAKTVRMLAKSVEGETSQAGLYQRIQLRAALKETQREMLALRYTVKALLG